MDRVRSLINVVQMDPFQRGKVARGRPISAPALRGDLIIVAAAYL